MNPVVHFEMPAEDRKRMAEFYTRAFGWRTQMLGPEMRGGPIFRDRMAAWLRWILGSITPPISPRLPA